MLDRVHGAAITANKQRKKFASVPFSVFWTTQLQSIIGNLVANFM
jgi:hypothetical protein